jgi:hypothetical protein
MNTTPNPRILWPLVALVAVLVAGAVAILALAGDDNALRGAIVAGLLPTAAGVVAGIIAFLRPPTQ